MAFLLKRARRRNIFIGQRAHSFAACPALRFIRGSSLWFLLQGEGAFGNLVLAAFCLGRSIVGFLWHIVTS
jgi:hypothetical protein